MVVPKFVFAVLWISSMLSQAHGSFAGKVEVAKQIVEVADKGVDLVQKVQKIVQDKLDSHYKAVAKPPANLISPNAVGEIAKEMTTGQEIEFKETSGFDGVDEYRLPGWKLTSHQAKVKSDSDDDESEEKQGYVYTMGVGNLLMSGCFGSGYKNTDPCYKLAAPVDRCTEQIDAANFIGVGFDLTKTYTSESRMKSVVQRVCANQAGFLGKHVPDNMNAFGIYDYKIGTKSFQSVDGYREYLAKKAGTSMSAGVFMELASKFSRTKSGGSASLFHNVGTGKSVGGSSNLKMGTKFSASMQQQATESSTGTNNNFLAVLTAEIILYEIALDHSGPGDLSQAFLRDFSKLPTSYYHIGADVKLQDFILRYGTHYVKSAKFGGKLNIFKKVAKNTQMTSSQFAQSSESEFSAMMSTMSSSYAQKHTKVSVLGFGYESDSRSQSESAMGSEQTQNQRSEENSGRQSSSKSESIETTVEAQGGNPEIAAAIMDFYTPAFRSQFVAWLNTIDEYPKAFDMTLGRLSDLFNVNADDLFKEGNPNAGCLGDNVKTDEKGRKYFIKETLPVKPKKKSALKKPVEKEPVEKEPAIQGFARQQPVQQEHAHKQPAQQKQKRTFHPRTKRDVEEEVELRPAFTLLSTQMESKVGQKDTLKIRERIYCNNFTSVKEDREKFMRDFKARRLALERAITIYLAEGPFSTTSFELSAGKKGCEMETLDYATGSLKSAKVWPEWATMNGGEEFKVVFRLPRHLPFLRADQEFNVKKHLGHWYFKIPGNHYTIDNSCQTPKGLHKGTRICVVGMILTYSPDQGLFQFDQEYYNRTNVKYTAEGNLTRSFGANSIARCESDNVLTKLDKQMSLGVKESSGVNQLVEVPCNVKWTNSHRIDPNEITSCIHFAAASEGDMFVAFSSIPKDHSTWFYVQISPTGVAFYHKMVLKHNVVGRHIGTLGDKSLFETFFVCIEQPRELKKNGRRNGNIRISYGKSPSDKEIGNTLATHQFIHTTIDTVSFYTFGSGENKVIVDDVRVVKGSPSVICGYGLKKVVGKCVKDCDKQCAGTCRRAFDPHSCIGTCKNVKHFDKLRQTFHCREVCPAGFEPIDQTDPKQRICEKCSPGHYKNSEGNHPCSKCDVGMYAKDEGMKECKPCAAGNYTDKIGQNICKQCEPGTFQENTGQEKCEDCGVGHYQADSGQTECKKCNPGTKQNIRGQASCSHCTPGSYQQEKGKSICEPCPEGTYEEHHGSKQCSDCEAGYECPSKGLKKQIACANNHYSAEPNSTKCTACEGSLKSISPAASCNNQCPAGEYMPPGTKTCQKCRAGTISSATGSSSCKGCSQGFEPNSAQTQCIDIDECSRQSPCKNGGTCDDTEGSYKCVCTSGWTGKDCDKNVNECSASVSPCQNSARCEDTQGSFKCICVSGFKGKRCETDINECNGNPNPCGPANNCFNEPGGYGCHSKDSCPQGYSKWTFDQEKTSATVNFLLGDFACSSGNQEVSETKAGQACINSCRNKGSVVNGITRRVDGATSGGCYCEKSMTAGKACYKPSDDDLETCSLPSASKTAESWIICKEKCQMRRECNHWFYKEGTQQCWLQRTSQWCGETAGVISGPKYKMFCEAVEVLGTQADGRTGGWWGQWGEQDLCPPGEFAVGYALKSEGSQGSGNDNDDTALNGIRLLCNGGTKVTSKFEKFGAWQSALRCTTGKGAINGFKIKIEDKAGLDADDTGANQVDIACLGGSPLTGNGKTPWGTWSVMKTCSGDKVVIGLTTRVEEELGEGVSGADDTALNGMQLICAERDPSAISSLA